MSDATLKSEVWKLLSSGSFAGVMLFVFSTGFPPLDDAAEVDMTAHMLQHILIILAGVMVAYPLMGRRIVRGDWRLGGWLPGASLVCAAALIVIWHLPGPWDSAVLNPGIHVLEHVSFFAVGALSGSAMLGMTDYGKVGALLAAFFGHMVYAVVLISPWNQQVYALYSIGDQAILGWVLLLTGPSILVGVVYVFASNPGWRAGFYGRDAGSPAKRPPFRAATPRWVPLLLTAVMAFALVAYYGSAAYAAASASQGPGGAVVSIYETPVSWQFSPRNITVVLGVNASVTWVSHSLSFDTVTASGGAFSSGAIPPGGKFQFSFSKPGVYDYYCQFHPWMTGSVTVLG